MSDGRSDEFKGRIKEAAGDLTDDEELERDGKVDRATGKVKDAVDDIAERVKGAVRQDSDRG